MLEEIDGDPQMHREVGEFFIETDYELTKDDLEEKVKSPEVRVEQLMKQETRVQEKFESLREELQQMLQGGVGDAGPVGPDGMQMSQPADGGVIGTTTETAESLVFARSKWSCVKDFDITMTFENGVPDVDVYVNVSDDADDVGDMEVIAEEAALTAQEAVDGLLAAADEEQGMFSRVPPILDAVRWAAALHRLTREPSERVGHRFHIPQVSP